MKAYKSKTMNRGGPYRVKYISAYDVRRQLKASYKQLRPGEYERNPVDVMKFVSDLYISRTIKYRECICFPVNNEHNHWVSDCMVDIRTHAGTSLRHRELLRQTRWLR